MSHTISPLDGRYAEKIGHLGSWFSEFALAEARVQVECAWILAQEKTGLWPVLTGSQRSVLRELLERFDDGDFARIKDIEAVTRHDVKAVELFLREQLSLPDPNRIHFGLTSEDVTNLSYALMLDGYRLEAQLPLLDGLLRTLRDMAAPLRDAAMPTRTHGQKASPSTAGKEIAVFLERLLRLRERLAAFRFRGKVNGATGNWSALVAAHPDFDWMGFCEGFVEQMGFEANRATTQIEDHDAWAEYLSITRQVANVVLDLDRDFWLYLSLGFFRERADPAATGSSTMPHKVNPIRFENSEGNLELAVGLLGTLADKLCRSRLQRDLSDSTVSRSVGVALAHVHLALSETRAGLEALVFDHERCLAELDASPELLSEPIQTILRTAGVEDPYALLKAATRGRGVTREDLMALVDGLDLPRDVRERCHGLRVRDYLGLAPAICDRVVAHADRVLASPAEEAP
ncbi:MAG: adenylosuccinate lyase [Deltaproteobacteria bacterium]|nr:adenylosuccinate lyase [Deltaproteobacteria bacterium]